MLSYIRKIFLKEISIMCNKSIRFNKLVKFNSCRWHFVGGVKRSVIFRLPRRYAY